MSPVTLEATDLLIYGAGGFGREIEWLASECFRYDAYDAAHSTVGTRGFIDDDPSPEALCGLPVLSLADARGFFPEAAIILAIGSGHVRELLSQKVRSSGAQFATLVHPDTRRGPRVVFGEGTVVCAGNILTTDITVGRHVVINLACTVGHDVVIEDFATVCPGVHVSGNVSIGARAFIGTGAVINNGQPGHPIRIGKDAVIGAGAVVTGDVPDGCTAVGIPAKVVRRPTPA